MGMFLWAWRLGGMGVRFAKRDVFIDEQCLADEPFDGLEMFSLANVAERDGNACRSGAAGAAGAMYVGFWFMGEIVV